MNVATVFQRFPVELGYQFGSSSTGKTGPMSDIDVAVLVSPTVPASDYLRLQIELLRALDPVFDFQPVDLVLLNQAGPLLRYEVVKARCLLYAREEATRIAFEERVLRDYLDTKHLRQVHTQALLARLKDGAFGDRSRVYFV